VWPKPKLKDGKKGKSEQVKSKICAHPDFIRPEDRVDSFNQVNKKITSLERISK